MPLDILKTKTENESFIQTKKIVTTYDKPIESAHFIGIENLESQTVECQATVCHTNTYARNVIHERMTKSLQYVFSSKHLRMVDDS